MRLDLVVGPNGAGKSTFVALTLLPVVRGSVFVNADEIARSRWPDDPEANSYDAALIAAATRSKLIETHQSLIAETVFSHPSKLELITDAHGEGFTVAVHALAVPEQLAVARVRSRVEAGGHSVPEDKIHERYRRLWPLVVRAIAAADTAVVYDNSCADGPRELARYVAGRPVGRPSWPAWTPEALRGTG